MTQVRKFGLLPQKREALKALPKGVVTEPPPCRATDPIAEAMEQAAIDAPRLLMPEQVAQMLGLTERTLERWRITGEGPRYVKLSRSTVRYILNDVTAFIANRLRAHTAQ